MTRGPEIGPKQAKSKPPEKVKRPRASRLRNFFSTVKHNLFLALIAGILAFAGAVWGAILVQNAIWEEQTGYDLTVKRIELIERTVDLMGKSTAVIGQDKNYTRSFLTAMAKTAGDPTKAVGIISNMLRESSETRCNIAQAHAEFISLLALNEIFFGERTRTAVRSLQEVDPWWEADSALKADLIEALKADFYHEESPL
ncbi:hypothetical protein ES707_22277 [subsurface metagenome]